MKTTKNIQAAFPQIKTFNSQQSNIDLFSKLESSFLEKFFKYNLTDYFPDTFANLYQDVLSKKSITKAQKNLTSNLFLVNQSFIVEEFVGKVNRFYTNKSISISEKQLPYAFKYQYCSRNPAPNIIQQNQLVYTEVKVKIEVEKIQEFPEKIEKMLRTYNAKDQDTHSKSDFQKILANYKEEYFTIFFVYFGDSNFNIFNKKKYQKLQKVSIMGKNYKLRLFVFYVSRQALIECFRTINKINNLEYINDLVIQFYELKRDKQRRKRKREHIAFGNEEESIFTLNSDMLYKIVGIVTLVGLGVVIKKIFL